MDVVLDDIGARTMPNSKRFKTLKKILETSDDESLRVDAVWLTSEMVETIGQSNPLFDKIADLLVWVLQNDESAVVQHEAAFELGAKNMRKKIPDLIKSALHDKKVLVRHEAIEALGLIRSQEPRKALKKALEDSSEDVRETAIFVLKRLDRVAKAENKML